MIDIYDYGHNWHRLLRSNGVSLIPSRSSSIWVIDFFIVLRAVSKERIYCIDSVLYSLLIVLLNNRLILNSDPLPSIVHVALYVPLMNQAVICSDDSWNMGRPRRLSIYSEAVLSKDVIGGISKLSAIYSARITRLFMCLRVSSEAIVIRAFFTSSLSCWSSYCS